MKKCLVLFVVSIFVAIGPRSEISAEDVGIRAPKGFEVSLYADDSLAHDIFSMTIDSHGRVVVAGKGYVKILHDTDDDGRADKATLFSDIPKSGAHGMAFLGNDLVCTGDNSVMLLRDKDGDGKADGKPEIWTNLKHAEHGANGVTIGSDGWIYVICGNDAGVSEKHATLPTSPVKKPQCGAIVRFSPDGKNSEIVAHGFRNPYDMAFNSYGHMFTVDADGERDQYLPWYTPTRLFDIAVGQHHGWVLNGWQRSWNRPEYFFDNVPRLVEIGRGSPTGIEVYRHRQFPEHYYDGVFSCCWTLGRVYYFPLKVKGSSYESKKEIFLETTGDVGFAPVDLAVGPDGDLFVAIGGRGTRGSVFRVSYKPDGKGPVIPQAWDSFLDRLLNPDQPLASWSRAKWIPLAKEVGGKALRDAVAGEDLTDHERIRAIEMLTELFDGTPYLARQFALAEGRDVARYLWSAARSPRLKEREIILAQGTYSSELFFKRAAWESLAQLDFLLESEHVNWDAVWKDEDRRVRSAALTAAISLNSGKLYPDATNARSHVANHWMYMGRRQLEIKAFEESINAFETVSSPWELDTTQVRLESVRTMQLCLGGIRTAPTEPEIHSGYLANDRNRITVEARGRALAALTRHFPTRDPALNREIARLLGMLSVGSPRTLGKMVGCFTYSTRPEDAIHYLNVISLIPGERSERVTKRTAMALAFLHVSMILDDKPPSRNWPLRVGELFSELAKRDPKLPSALVADTGFRCPNQAMFGLRMKGEDRLAAARKLLKMSRLLGDDGDEWTAELVELVACLPAEESLPALRSQWHNFELRDAIVEALAREPRKEDRSRFVDSLDSFQSSTIELAANSLRTIGGEGQTEEIATAMQTLRQQCSGRQMVESRRALAELLQVWTGQSIEVKEPTGSNVLLAYQPWFDWFGKAHAEIAAKMTGVGSDANWQKRLAKIEWTAGDAKRGETVFQRFSCAACHGANSRLGPELKGVAGRFSREDLFATIVDPNKDVSPLYYTTQVVTESGKVYRGMMVYESPDGTLIQTGPNETIRIAGDQIVQSAESRHSIMPTGLLDKASDDQIRDLYVYLKTLR